MLPLLTILENDEGIPKTEMALQAMTQKIEMAEQRILENSELMARFDSTMA